MEAPMEVRGAEVHPHVFPYVRHPDQDAAAPARRPVVVVGAGPVGLAVAIGLAQFGTHVVLLDEGDRVSTGSRAICFAKRTLEVFDRLGCGETMVRQGVGWDTGRVFLRDAPLYAFNLLEEPGHERPAFINLPQPEVEARLLDRARALPGLEIRWQNRVEAVSQDAETVHLAVGTPDGPYRLDGTFVVAADGARSPVRGMLGHERSGQTFRDRFLIADVRMRAPFPAERWFWFDPPFHPGGSVLLHRQPDDLWRIDFQLGWDADPAVERTPERVLPRIRALLGPDVAFELDWVSVYTFSCARMASFRDKRVLFAGDSAHTVSPFGARGANSGVQDADNLAWKLHAVLNGAPHRLLDSYAHEREAAADENIRASTRSTDFITPKSEASRTFRDAVLSLARDCPFAQRLVNSGRLSTPSSYPVSTLNTPDEDAFESGVPPGGPASDAPLGEGWLLRALGPWFTLLVFGKGDVGSPPEGVHVVPVGPGADLANRRYDARPGTTYLLRPDGHVCARWRAFDRTKVAAALARAGGTAC